jgi:hypothetical protein
MTGAGRKQPKLESRKPKAETAKESSSVFFQSLNPKFLDWMPPTEEEKALAVIARREAREVELKRVTGLAAEREAEKAAMRKRYRSAASGKKRRNPR